MNIKSYIKSGILERYALGELSDAEAVEVEMLLSENLELGEELEHVYSRLEEIGIIPRN